MNEPTIYEVLGRVLVLLFVALMAWTGWTYLEIGATFFGWLPPIWLNITLGQFIGLVIMIQSFKWLLRGLRIALIGR